MRYLLLYILSALLTLPSQSLSKNPETKDIESTPVKSRLLHSRSNKLRTRNNAFGGTDRQIGEDREIQNNKVERATYTRYMVITEANLVPITRFLGLPGLNTSPATSAGSEQANLKLLSVKHKKQ
ncbi:MAG: hypothetical protein ACI9FB_001415 [Candidatus Azotimanducaceae bacterium]|jgi:hypothetical protein